MSELDPDVLLAQLNAQLQSLAELNTYERKLNSKLKTNNIDSKSMYNSPKANTSQQMIQNTQQSISNVSKSGKTPINSNSHLATPNSGNRVVNIPQPTPNLKTPRPSSPPNSPKIKSGKTHSPMKNTTKTYDFNRSSPRLNHLNLKKNENTPEWPSNHESFLGPVSNSAEISNIEDNNSNVYMPLFDINALRVDCISFIYRLRSSGYLSDDETVVAITVALEDDRLANLYASEVRYDSNMFCTILRRIIDN
eukprot:TRINITY_DN3193_c1_g1_i1.p1 TRINITY_DN3193_c1_g1~~TRINITY_DN3193_c1_g1_i1.p1  ORF type:complete len:258 (+),score=61.41 TRINITY_DN3193_c1_g1_i1:24-776(+)